MISSPLMFIGGIVIGIGLFAIGYYVYLRVRLARNSHLVLSRDRIGWLFEPAAQDDIFNGCLRDSGPDIGSVSFRPEDFDIRPFLAMIKAEEDGL